jgi:hypothetical protein
VGFVRLWQVFGSRDECELMAKLVWWVKLVTELPAGETTEVEVAHIERDEQAGLSDLGLRLVEAKQLTSALQAEIVPAQVMIAGEHRCTCTACGRRLASKRHDAATFRSLFGFVPIRIRRLLTCPCQNGSEAKSFATFDLEAATVAPELAYVTARYAALAPFGKVADLLSELLPVSGAPNAGTVRNRTMRVGEAVVQSYVTTTAKAATPRPAEPVVVGLGGGYVRSRHRQDERHFEVIAGKVISAQGSQSRFAFARNSPAIASGSFKRALAMAGVTADTPATVLCDGDAGLWRLQREALPSATVVLDWCTPRGASNTRCRPLAALTRSMHTWPVRRFADWSVRSGTFGTGVGQDASAGSQRCAAGCGVHLYAARLASGTWNTTSASCWPTLSGTRERWSTMPPDVGTANRSRPLSSRVQSTRSPTNA